MVKAKGEKKNSRGGMIMIVARWVVQIDGDWESHKRRPRDLSSLSMLLPLLTLKGTYCQCIGQYFLNVAKQTRPQQLILILNLKVYLRSFITPEMTADKVHFHLIYVLLACKSVAEFDQLSIISKLKPNAIFATFAAKTDDAHYLEVNAAMKHIASILAPRVFGLQVVSSYWTSIAKQNLVAAAASGYVLGRE